MQHDPGNERRSHESTDRRAAVEDARGECAFLRREPLRHYSHASGPVPCFTHAKKKSKHSEGHDASRERVEDFGCRPPGYHQSISGLGAEAINDRTGKSI